MGISLEDQAKRLSSIEVACSRCNRRGRYRVTTLIENHGSKQTLPDLAGKLCYDCPQRNDVSPGKRCDIHYPNLAKS